MYQYSVTVVRWLDGDTVELIADLGFNTSLKEKFRLFDPARYIDTPERGEPGWAEAKELSNTYYPPGKTLVANTYKKDKYGRWLVHLPDLVTLLDSHGFLK